METNLNLNFILEGNTNLHKFEISHFGQRKMYNTLKTCLYNNNNNKGKTTPFTIYIDLLGMWMQGTTYSQECPVLILKDTEWTPHLVWTEKYEEKSPFCSCIANTILTISFFFLTISFFFLMEDGFKPWKGS